MDGVCEWTMIIFVLLLRYPVFHNVRQKDRHHCPSEAFSLVKGAGSVLSLLIWCASWRRARCPASGFPLHVLTVSTRRRKRVP